MKISSRNILAIVFLGIAIQLAAFYFIDPLGYPDTIRYFNFADFLRDPRIAHSGDLAYSNGLLFTSLFLPSFLLFF